MRVAVRGCGWAAGIAACVALHSPAAAAAEPDLILGSCEPLPANELAGALSARLGRTVQVSEAREAPGGASGDTWVVKVFAAPGGAVVTLESPAGGVWRREVAWAGDAGPVDRLRSTALAIEYLLALAESPFVEGPPTDGEVPREASEPPPAEVPLTPGPLPVPAAEAGGSTASPAPAGDATGSPLPWPEQPGTNGPWMGVAVRAGGAGDLSDRSPGRSRALLLGLRLDVEWPWGVWLEGEVDWHFGEESNPETLRLYQVPVRVGAGASLAAADWRIRIGLQAVVEAWWTSGGTPRSGWRPGGGLVLSVARHLLPWLVVGAEFGVDLLPPGVVLIYGETSVFSLGAWRWWSGVWVGFGSRAGV
ncbi:MAG: hypothetical protein HY907_21195 [Deltaproteobacteria bacterium]|nr:hypothetical protein [Deltaproteobacteria bacterium]